jgi:hypothetical protein
VVSPTRSSTTAAATIVTGRVAGRRAHGAAAGRGAVNQIYERTAR